MLSQSNLFDIVTLTLPDGGSWDVIRARPFSDPAWRNSLARAVEHARKKAQFTRDESQSGAYRSPEFKLGRQIGGTLAEVAAQELLREVLNEAGLSRVEVVRYDDIRTDGFRSAEGEFDLALRLGTSELTVEARSSSTYGRTIEESVRDLDTIGPYESMMKKGEALADFYIRPLYDEPRGAKPSERTAKLKAGQVPLYFTGGVTRETMQRVGRAKSMQQGGTVYQTVPIREGLDAPQFLTAIVEAIRELSI